MRVDFTRLRMQTAYLFSIDSPKEVVLVGNKKFGEFKSLLSEIQIIIK